MIRLFAALEIPETVRTRLALLQGGVPGARWASGEQMHLTLRFIGEVDDNVGHDIDDALALIRAPSFTLELAGVGEFGGKNPRALWAGVRPCDALVHLQKKIETALQRIGLPAEERKFSPHVTLARLREPGLDQLGHFLAAHAQFRAAPLPVEHFSLIASFPTKAGSVYEDQADYPLTG
jgi:2'-5' RNA ligase